MVDFFCTAGGFGSGLIGVQLFNSVFWCISDGALSSTVRT